MPNPFEVTIDVDAGRRTGAYRPIWNWVGYDEPNYTYTADGKKLLGQLAELSPRAGPHADAQPADQRRRHRRRSSGARPTPTPRMPNGNPVYDWTIIDKIFDAYVEAGNIPFVQVGFTPEALSDDPGPYQHSWALLAPYNNIMTGWAVPPNDLEQVGRADRSLGAPPRRALRRATRSRPGPGSAGTSPTATTGRARSPSIARCTTRPSRPCGASCPRPRVGGPHTCGAFNNEKAQTFLRGFLQHVSDTGVAARLRRLPRQGQAAWSRGPRADGARTSSSSTSTTNLAIINEFPKLKGVSRGDRRIRSRGLRRLLGPRPSAERLSQRAALRRLSRRAHPPHL